MKWLNKGLACILASGLLLTAAGCSGRPQKPAASAPETSATSPALPEAAGLYKAAMEKIEAEKAIAGSMEMEFTTSFAGITATFPIEMKLEAVEKEEKTLLHALVTTSVLGQSVNMEMWQDGEYQYTASQGQKIKQPMEEEDRDDLPSMEDLHSLEESLRENASVTAEEEGYRIVYRLPGGKLTSLLQTLLGMTGDNGLEELVDISYSDIEMSMVVDKASVLRKLSMSGEITGRITQPDYNDPSKNVEVEALYQYTFSLTVDKLGAEVTVTLPEDLDSFQEIPAGVEEAILTEVLESLFDEYGQPVANFDEIYEQLAAKYGYDQVDQALSRLLGSDDV